MSHDFLDRRSNTSGSSRNNANEGPAPTHEMLREYLEQRMRRNEMLTAQMFARDEEDDKRQVQQKVSDEESLQRKGEPGQGTTTSMPADVQSKMENSFGTDFSGVNIHKDSEQANALGALAYTQGSDVHFAPGQYNPGSQKGQELIGHELTHVVQQRQGRVKPDAQQHKGVNINSDPALEKEADDMGAKAAQGKMADVKKKGSGVQRKEEDPPSRINVLLEDNWIADDKIVEGVPVLGTYSYIAPDGRHVTQYVLAGTKAQWSQLLSKSDGKAFFQTFIYGFLKAANDPSWINKGDANNMQSKKQINVSRAPNKDEKLNFLHALYGQDVETDLDLPDNRFEQGATGFDFHSDWVVYPAFAEFIAKYQGILIEDISKRSQNQIIKEKGLGKLAEQGTLYSHAATNNPVVVKSMIQNAYASALSAAKILIDGSVINKKTPVSILTAFNTVYNSGKIINKSISGYDKKIKGMKEGAKSVFNSAWSMIPLNNAAAKVIGEMIKGPLEKTFIDSLGFKEMNPLIEDFYNKFNSLQGTIELILKNNSNNINVDGFINRYEIMLGKFHDGLYQ